MKISVVVPAFNEQKLIVATLRSIQAAMTAFSDKGWETELVVCNNNSSDRTGDLAASEGATVVFEPINQIGRARNRGAHGASGDWLIFVDADSTPSCELFSDVAAEIQKGNCLAGGSTVRLDEFHFLAEILVRGWNWLSRIKKWGPGSFIFCEAAAFREVGGFSPDLYVSEEVELFQRLKALARRRRKRVVILHRHPLVTSSRKLHLYTLREHIRFLVKMFCRPGRTLRDSKECFTWYDGRR